MLPREEGKVSPRRDSLDLGKVLSQSSQGKLTNILSYKT